MERDMNRFKIYAGVLAVTAAAGGLGLASAASAATMGHGHDGGSSYSYRFERPGSGSFSRGGSRFNYQINRGSSRDVVIQSNAGDCDVNVSLINSPNADINVAQNCILTVTTSG
jgi:hypothetical protein